MERRRPLQELSWLQRDAGLALGVGLPVRFTPVPRAGKDRGQWRAQEDSHHSPGGPVFPFFIHVSASHAHHSKSHPDSYPVRLHTATYVNTHQ